MPTGHWPGLDVHDINEYFALEEAPVEQPDALGASAVRKPSRVLQPGIVVTVEPRLYVRPAEGVPEKFWRIGIRIEDEALITPEGCELISRAVRVRAGAMHKLLRISPTILGWPARWRCGPMRAAAGDLRAAALSHIPGGISWQP